MNKYLSGFIKFVIIAAIIAGAYALYKKYKKEHFEDDDYKLSVEYYGATWCGHCQKFAPEYEKFRLMVEEDSLPVNVLSFDADEENDKSKFTANDISSFPTILIVKDGDATVYEGSRDADSLMVAVKKML